MGQIKNLKDKIFGRLKVIEFSKIENRRAFWKCVCECNVEVICNANYLTSGDKKSCGCLRKESSSKNISGQFLKSEKTKRNEKFYIDGVKNPLLAVLNSIKQRCYNKNCREYRWYGAKGIEVCDEWKNNPEKFIDWAKSNGYVRGLTIDRKDCKKGYFPENCQLLTREDNCKKMREDNLKNGKNYFKERSNPKKYVYRPYKSR